MGPAPSNHLALERWCFPWLSLGNMLMGEGKPNSLYCCPASYQLWSWVKVSGNLYILTRTASPLANRPISLLSPCSNNMVSPLGQESQESLAVSCYLLCFCMGFAFPWSLFSVKLPLKHSLELFLWNLVFLLFWTFPGSRPLVFSLFCHLASEARMDELWVLVNLHPLS